MDSEDERGNLPEVIGGKRDEEEKGEAGESGRALESLGSERMLLPGHAAGNDDIW